MATVNDIMVFVHGVPKGQDYWESEKTDDKSYIGNFYTNKDKTFKFVAEVRKGYCYYHYLCYNSNIVDYDNRPGAYFGLTVRLDAYCRDWQTIYHIMDVVYKSAVIGSLLVADREKLKYSVERFDSASDILKKIQNETIETFTKVFASKGFNYFASLDGFSRSSRNVWKNNLGACGRDEFEEALKKWGKVELSPDYPMARIAELEEQYNNKLNEKQTEFDKRLKDMQKQNSNDKNGLQTQVDELEKQNQELTKKVKEGEKEKAELQSKVAQAARILGEVSATLSPQAGHDGKSANESSDETNKHVAGKHKAESAASSIKGLLPVANFILLLLIAASLQLKGCGEVQQERQHDTADPQQAAATNSTGFGTEYDLPQTDDSNGGAQGQPAAQPDAEGNDVEANDAEANDMAVHQASPEHQGNYKIDIKEYTGKGPLTINNVYTVKVNKTHEQAILFAEGCKVDNETDVNSSTIRITPIEETVTISYQYFDGNKKVTLCERTLKAK